MRPLIIDAPSLQSLRQKYVSSILTFIFWVIWFFLWTPLATLIAWYFGVDLVYFQMIELEGSKGIVEDFYKFLICVAIMGLVFISWALYNFMRYGKLDRRQPLPAVTNAELADYFHIDETGLNKDQGCKYLSLAFDEAGNILECRELTVPAHELS